MEGEAMVRNCPKCGASYELDEFKCIVRDKDSLECNFCGETIISWNGGSFFVIKKVLSEPTNNEYKKKK